MTHWIWHSNLSLEQREQRQIRAGSVPKVRSQASVKLDQLVDITRCRDEQEPKHDEQVAVTFLTRAICDQLL